MLSETMRDQPDARVETWLARQSPPALFTTAITEVELLHGIAALPDGRRRPASAP